MELIDNINKLLGDDLKVEISKNSKLSISAAYFSIYAYKHLKNQLQSVESLRFLFTSPTFISDSIKKEKREFYIPKLNREKSISGTEFEVKLKNELTQKSIAKECADWINKKVTFKSIKDNRIVQGNIIISDKVKETETTYMPITGFSSVDIGYEKGNILSNPIAKISDYNLSKQYLNYFNLVWNDKEKLEDVTSKVIEYITTVYKENSPEFIYYIILYNIFNEFLEDINEDTLPNEKVGFTKTQIWNKLYNFQKDAVRGIINKLEEYNGCILADSVGLGKTFTALGVIKYYELRNKTVLVLCPKKLGDNWLTYNQNVKNNILLKDRFSYDVLFHTDLSRNSGKSNNMNLNTVNWDNYDLLVIDESHNFRNNVPRKDKETRYQKLINKVIKSGVKTKVLMLSATPVNNKFNDLKNQLALAYEGNESEINEKLRTKDGIGLIFRKAQAAFNEWAKLPIEEKTTDKLLSTLSFDFFELLDSVTIARSRKHIQRYYDVSEIGQFPKRKPPISIECGLTKQDNVIAFNEIFKELTQLNMSVYAPTNYVLESKRELYEKLYDTEVKGGTGVFRQTDRDLSLQKLMRVNLLKRLESSVYSFNLTLNRLYSLINSTLQRIYTFDGIKNSDIELNMDDYMDDSELEDEDIDMENAIGGKVKIDLKHMDLLRWREDLEWDKQIIENLINEMNKVTPEFDEKLNRLKSQIDYKLSVPINKDNKKIIIFTAFSDTANYLYEHISRYVKNYYSLNTAKVTGAGNNQTTANIKNDFSLILTCFSPISKEKEIIYPELKENIDILIATDCISEGQNLQDCDYLINYDIHWNPVRIIQRFGRIDRIGSHNDYIQLVNFWPDMTLDEYLNLKQRVEDRMLVSDLAGTADYNPLTNKSTDVEYRKRQLEHLKKEVVDLEDMNTGINITDLGLNDFRMDLLQYAKEKGSLEKVPHGMHTVVLHDNEKGIYSGVIFVLKNINNEINIENQNRIHPFYLVYINENEDILCNHMEPKKILDFIRALCRGKDVPVKEAFEQFNNETNDGRNMDKYSHLLHQSIKSIIDVKDESDIRSLFKSGATTSLLNNIKGLEDFELISFIVIK